MDWLGNDWKQELTDGIGACSWRRRHLLGSPSYSRRPIKGMRVRFSPSCLVHLVDISANRIVEFANDEDARRAKVELADKAFMGRSVFIREVSKAHRETH